MVHAGLGSTDLLYYASGSLGLPGVMFTASHNPARYNGMKMCRAGAVPIGGDTGLTEIRDRAAEILASGAAGTGAVSSGTAAGDRSSAGTCSGATPTTCAAWSTCPASGR
nr:hypothetical protein GCM10020093_092950 [Planobispora longispora]